VLWPIVVEPIIPGFIRAGARRLRRQPTWLTQSVIRPEFARRTGVVERVEAFECEQERPARSAREAHARAMTSGLIPYALELADKAAGAFGVEPRYPFFDHRLMELCLALPSDQKLHDGWTRMVMRRAMQGLLPEQVRWRSSKANLAPNFTRRLLEQDRSLVAEVILEQPGVIEPYVDLAALRRAYDRYVVHPTSEPDIRTVYGAVMLGLWLQRAKIA
jgi:asparagine synthase (glutamine-hydrolysing)